MTIAIPSLDDRTYADLVAEAVALIPAHDPGWTDHNASDPGITLIELFAWLAEMMIFNLDQSTAEQRVTFLRLLNGPGWTPEAPPARVADLDAETVAALRALREPYRAVTAADHAALALAAHPDVRRAHCIPRADLETRARSGAAGHVSVVVVPAAGAAAAPAEICRSVRAFFEPRRLLTTRLHVVPAAMVPVATRVAVVPRADALDDRVRDAVVARLTAWLDPLTGGDGSGWPFGRPVYGSELYRVVEEVPGVDHVPALRVAGAVAPGGAAADAPADALVDPIWNDAGALIGAALAPHGLPLAPAGAHDVRCVHKLLPAEITVPLALAPGASRDAARRAATAALDDYAWSLLLPRRESTVTEGAIQDALARNGALRPLATVSDVRLSPREVKLPADGFLDAAYRLSFAGDAP